MLKKLLAILIISLSSFSVFADAKDDVIVLLTQRLEESTQVIQELTNENKELRAELTEYQGSDIDNLMQVINNLLARLEESTSLIEEQSNQIREDQKEIAGLRDSLNETLNNYRNSSLINLQLGATFPLGAHVGIDFRIPAIPVGIYANAGVMTDESKISDITGVNIFVGGGIRLGL